MTARVEPKSTPPATRGGPPNETDHWKVEKDPANPKKAEWKPSKGGYQTKPVDGVPMGLEAVHIWMQDMREWGIMMQEAIVELRQRVEELEKK
jgi:hypothetical protein